MNNTLDLSLFRSSLPSSEEVVISSELIGSSSLLSLPHYYDHTQIILVIFQ